MVESDIWKRGGQRAVDPKSIGYMEQPTQRGLALSLNASEHVMTQK